MPCEIRCFPRQVAVLHGSKYIIMEWMVRTDPSHLNFVELLLMAEIPRENQLRLVVENPIIYRVLAPSQVVFSPDF